MVTHSEWNVRNELRLPIKYDANLEKLNLDLTTPRIRAAMRNLGVKPEDLRVKPKEEGVAPEIARLRYEANKRQLVKTVNRVLTERKRVEREGPDLVSKKPSVRQLIQESFTPRPKFERHHSVTFIEAPLPMKT